MVASPKVKVGLCFASWASWPRKSAATVVSTAMPFFGMMIDSLKSSGGWWVHEWCRRNERESDELR